MCVEAILVAALGYKKWGSTPRILSMLPTTIAIKLRKIARIIVDLKNFEKEGKLIRTLNGMGHSIVNLTEYSQAFLDFAPKAPGPVLDIGAAFGVASLPALERGAEVIINDMAQEHLDAIAENMPDELKSRVHYCCGRIPQEIFLKPESLGAIHCSQVFHFLTGDELTQTFKLMYTWLKPEGKIFIIASSPYIHILENYLPQYEAKKANGVPWPGEVENLKKITNHPVVDANPPFFNFLDNDVLAKIAVETGFHIEKISLFDRGELPDHIKFDGRENVGLIAQKIVE